MDNDTIVSIGDFCESLMLDDRFNNLVSGFEGHTVAQMLSTKPNDAEEREKLFAHITGVREFMSFMLNVVEHKRKLTAPLEPVDHSDDPSVHNIYEEQD